MNKPKVLDALEDIEQLETLIQTENEAYEKCTALDSEAAKAKIGLRSAKESRYRFEKELKADIYTKKKTIGSKLENDLFLEYGTNYSKQVEEFNEFSKLLDSKRGELILIAYENRYTIGRLSEKAKSDILKYALPISFTSDIPTSGDMVINTEKVHMKTPFTYEQDITLYHSSIRESSRSIFSKLEKNKDIKFGEDVFKYFKDRLENKETETLESEITWYIQALSKLNVPTQTIYENNKETIDKCCRSKMYDIARNASKFPKSIRDGNLDKTRQNLLRIDLDAAEKLRIADFYQSDMTLDVVDGQKIIIDNVPKYLEMLQDSCKEKEEPDTQEQQARTPAIM